MRGHSKTSGVRQALPLLVGDRRTGRPISQMYHLGLQSCLSRTLHPHPEPSQSHACPWSLSRPIHPMGTVFPAKRLGWDPVAVCWPAHHPAPGCSGLLGGGVLPPLPTHPGAPLPADEKGSNAAPGHAASPGLGALGPWGLGGSAAAEADEVDSDEDEA